LFISLLIEACAFFRNFEGNDLSYEEWKSVLHLSTRWGFASLRNRALGSIEPPTPHDRLLLARTYSVNDWVVPALSALCERTTPLTLSEARQMSIEDVVLISTVREHIRGRMLQVDSAEISLRVEAEQLIALGSKIPPHLRFPPHFPDGQAPLLMDLKPAKKEDDGDAHGSDGECPVSQVAVRSRGELVKDTGIDNSSQAEEEAPGDICLRTGEPSRVMKNSREEVTATQSVETGAATRMSKKARNVTEEVAAKRAEEESVLVAKLAEDLKRRPKQRKVVKASKALGLVAPASIQQGNQGDGWLSKVAKQVQAAIEQADDKTATAEGKTGATTPTRARAMNLSMNGHGKDALEL
jgi:hypothetical protein